MENTIKGKRPIIIWLFIGCFLVATMVVVGGITRLTHSGLSMADWQPFIGTFPPTTEAKWMEKFELYKQTPEYKKVNTHYGLEEFKSIFWWEYIHRLLGRMIGLVFLIPFIYFLFKKWVRGALRKKLIIIFLLGGFQGVLGWFMVMSGLVDRPSVSHYRLAAHLVTALILYAYIFWVALDLIYPVKEKLNSLYKSFRKSIHYLSVILLFQIIYGAFVAGLKAGFIMNTWPKMGEDWVHPSIGRAFSTMGLAALTEHILTVQFIHRYLAVILVLAGLYVWWKFKNAEIKASLKVGLNWMLAVFAFQFLLGVFTLIYIVPVWLGVLHQFGAIVLLTVIVYLIHRVKSEKALQ